MTVLEHLVRCGVSEQQARQHLTAGHVRVNGMVADGVDAELPPTAEPESDSVLKPVVVIQPY